MKIIVERQKGSYGKFRALDILIDGVLQGSIKEGETIAFEVPDCNREIWGKMDWAETQRLSLQDYDPGKTIVFEGYFSLNPFKNLGVSKMPFKAFFR